MPDPDGPWLTAWIAAAKIEVPAGINQKILERPKLLRGQVNRQPFRNGSEIENQRAKQRDRLLDRVQPNVPIADRAAGFERRSNRPPMRYSWLNPRVSMA